ncbi:uncharacterized protein LOC122400181 [Colletes gigas]|uniref:uncharacterized protein LOC122400181 n=1 Tax=Colletes gigas TaxID=935657 RepID=UPI001C9AC727|nr:uncharacterized protein LOC122400181 [Colletes gigas]
MFIFFVNVVNKFEFDLREEKYESQSRLGRSTTDHSAISPLKSSTGLSKLKTPGRGGSADRRNGQQEEIVIVEERSLKLGSSIKVAAVCTSETKQNKRLSKSRRVRPPIYSTLFQSVRHRFGPERKSRRSDLPYLSRLRGLVSRVRDFVSQPSSAAVTCTYLSDVQVHT